MIVLVRMIVLIHLFVAVDVPKGCATGGRKNSGISSGIFSMCVCAYGVCSNCASESFGMREFKQLCMQVLVLDAKMHVHSKFIFFLNS